MEEFDACVLKGLRQMPLVALKRCLAVCENTPKHILLTGAVRNYIDETY